MVERLLEGCLDAEYCATGLPYEFCCGERFFMACAFATRGRTVTPEYDCGIPESDWWLSSKMTTPIQEIRDCATLGLFNAVVYWWPRQRQRSSPSCMVQRPWVDGSSFSSFSPMNNHTRPKITKYLVWPGWLTKSGGRISPLCHAFLLLLQYHLLPSKVGHHGCYFISKASSSFFSLSLLLLLQSPYFQVGVLKHALPAPLVLAPCPCTIWVSSMSRQLGWSMVPFLFARKLFHQLLLGFGPGCAMTEFIDEVMPGCNDVIHMVGVQGLPRVWGRRCLQREQRLQGKFGGKGQKADRMP